MQVFVVMGNDYPDSVFLEEKAAERYCEEKRNSPEEKRHRERWSGTSVRIYWRVYKFELK